MNLLFSQKSEEGQELSDTFYIMYPTRDFVAINTLETPKFDDCSLFVHKVHWHISFSHICSAFLSFNHETSSISFQS
jgi:hypothetical protein